MKQLCCCLNVFTMNLSPLLKNLSILHVRVCQSRQIQHQVGWTQLWLQVGYISLTEACLFAEGKEVTSGAQCHCPQI